MKKIKIIKKKEIILSLLSILFLFVSFISVSPSFKNKAIGKEQDENKQLGEAVLVNSNSVEKESNLIEINNDVEDDLEDNEELDKDYNDFFIRAKMDRDNIYSQTLEIYENILESSEIANDQKLIAQNEITNISNERKTIAVAENLILLKGFENVVIFKNNNDVSIIVKSDVLLPENVSQIQNIVQREFQIDSKNINITNK